MTTVQLGWTLLTRLQKLGLGLPEDMLSAEIILPGYQLPVQVVVRFLQNLQERKELYYITLPDGKLLMSEDFINVVKVPMQLPDEITEFKICMEPNAVATTRMSCATPEGSMDFLRGCKIITKETEKEMMAEKVKNVLRHFIVR